MKQSEKILAGLTAAAFVLFVGWQMGLESVFDNLGSGSGEVGRLERQFNANLEALGDMLEVEEQYRQIAQNPAGADPNLSPALAFSNEVSGIAQAKGFQFPPIRTRQERIEGVDQYQLLSVQLTTQGSFANTTELLKSLEEAGLIFRELTLQSVRDKDEIKATIVVARIAENTRRRSRSS